MTGFTPCLWFDGQAEEAARFYVSVFKNSRIIHIHPYGEAAAKASGRPLGSVLTVHFELSGQEFMALNGGPDFKFTPALSLMIFCETQDEVDAYWDKLSDGGQPLDCGWVTDRYGVTWQVVPEAMMRMIKEGTPEQVERQMAAMMTMQKIDLPTIERAWRG